MKVFDDPKKLQKWCVERKLAGAKIALVPTMGCLHEGHLSLIRAAQKRGADEIVVSIFVNPIQFGPNEDFDKYPRDEKSDLRTCKTSGATAVFFPMPSNMYASDHSTYINEELLSKGLCGARRPGHFRGVCTVVAKLFNIVQPHFAMFGQKDFQQVQVIRRMVRDLNFDVKVFMASIVREPSGLALSSRNSYLSQEDREKAANISRLLRSVREDERASEVKRRIITGLAKAGLKVDYVECVDASTLEDVSFSRRGSCVLVAAWCGATRLIDNRII